MATVRKVIMSHEIDPNGPDVPTLIQKCFGFLASLEIANTFKPWPEHRNINGILLSRPGPTAQNYNRFSFRVFVEERLDASLPQEGSIELPGVGPPRGGVNKKCSAGWSNIFYNKNGAE